MFFFFFFQAEDGIRDLYVTGVQTCALPISVDQISIEAAQPKLDLSVLERMDGKTIVLGVIDLGSEDVETVDIVAERIRAALRYIPAERLVLAPDCGMKYHSRQASFGKLKAMADAALQVRGELGAGDVAGQD